MSMTREELRQWFAKWLDDYYDGLYSEDDLTPEVAESALTALRPVSREQMEKVWRGEWKCHGDCGVTECSACGWNIEEYVGDYNFCPVCGAAQTDKAVEMVMERLEALHEDNSCS